MVASRGAPAGVVLLQTCFSSVGKHRRSVYQSSVLFLTFAAYTAYHMSRRPLAVVKNSLNQDCSRLAPPPDVIVTNATRSNWCDWAPFADDDANWLLGVLDSVFVFAYALSMFISGMVAERIDLRYFLALGMLTSGFFTYLFGLAFYLDMHSLAFFAAVQFLGGVVQCTGWPGVVSCVANWFGKSRRGLVFGLWNAHVYIGNILGAYVAGYFVAYNWGLSFIVPGAILGVVGLILFLFLVPHPEDVELSPANHLGEEKRSEPSGVFCLPHNKCKGLSGGLQSPDNQKHNESSPLAPGDNQNRGSKVAITFWDAVKIPGVLEFSVCLFFSKLVSYTFLYWLPRYLSHATGVGSQTSAYLSIAFDVGGIVGGIAAGMISDHTGSSALTCVGFLGLAVPSLFLFEAFGGVSKIINVVLQIVCGALVNGPYALITTAVSAELGTHKSIKNNAKALPTVTAIIDGTGSVGAAVGPLVAGVVSEYSWSYVFHIMMLADFLALVSLLRTAQKEARLSFGLHCTIPFVNLSRAKRPYQQIG